jgi:broad specificity phosphatase PhoE
MRRLLLVRHAPTPATRASAFPADEPLDDAGRAAVADLAKALPGRHATLCSPARRCRETAGAAGLKKPKDEPRIAECDFGSWAGRTLADVHEADPDASIAWMRDPDAAPHGGESLRTFAGRIAAWLDEQADRTGPAVAITHAGVVKSAVIHALGGSMSHPSRSPSSTPSTASAGPSAA